jgi:pyruvate formate lyase activating enzyme
MPICIFPSKMLSYIYMDKIEARYYEKLADNHVHCQLCPVGCHIAPSKQGICSIRTNEFGTLIATEYGRTVALNIDPIEKKPLYHFKPGSAILSVGPNGCNLSCNFCQNWTISQAKAGVRYVSPENLVRLALSNKSVGAAFTYTEPLIWFEYLLDSARQLRSAGLAAVLVSNAYINEAPARELFPYIAAVNFDLKSIRTEFYHRSCKGKLEDVKRTITIAHEMGVHLELTNLLITGLNDSNEDIRDLVSWVASLDKKIPLHFSRYFPHYKLDSPATPEERLEYAYKAGREKLEYVFVGNIAGIGNSDSLCQECGNTLVRRDGYLVDIIGMEGGKCSKCGFVSDIVV